MIPRLVYSLEVCRSQIRRDSKMIVAIRVAATIYPILPISGHAFTGITPVKQFTASPLAPLPLQLLDRFENPTPDRGTVSVPLIEELTRIPPNSVSVEPVDSPPQ
jgi:hypothetical protein